MSDIWNCCKTAPNIAAIVELNAIVWDVVVKITLKPTQT